MQRRWKLLDVLDPHRVSHGSLGTGFWRHIYEDILEEPGKDWAHANSIVYDASDDSVLVSLNHQSTLMKMRLEDSSIAWLLGDHAGWEEPWSDHLLEPEGDLIWTSNQHAAELTPTGTVLVFDNGGHRSPPFAPNTPMEERYSRAVEFRIDEEAMTTEELWSYGSLDTDHFFSSFLCDVDLQPTTGNVIVTDGARTRRNDGGMGDGPGGGPVETVNRVEVAAHLVPQHLQEEDPVGGFTAAMDQEPRGLVGNEEVVILVEDVDGVEPRRLLDTHSPLSWSKISRSSAGMRQGRPSSPMLASTVCPVTSTSSSPSRRTS